MQSDQTYGSEEQAEKSQNTGFKRAANRREWSLTKDSSAWHSKVWPQKDAERLNSNITHETATKGSKAPWRHKMVWKTSFYDTIPQEK